MVRETYRTKIQIKFSLPDQASDFTIHIFLKDNSKEKSTNVDKNFYLSIMRSLDNISASFKLKQW